MEGKVMKWKGMMQMDEMDELVKIIKESLRTDRDAVCAIGGSEGSGKSTLAIHLSRKLDDKFTLKRNVIFQPTIQNVTNTIYGLPKYSPVDVDEAMRTMYKRNFMTSDARVQAIIFSICRKENKPVFLNIPNFFDLDAYYRNHRVRVWLFVPERGLAMVLMKDPSPFISDPWHKDENQRIIEKLTRKSKFNIKSLESALRQTRNYVYEFEFPDLDPKTKALYQYYSNQLNPLDLIRPDKWMVRFRKLLNGVWKKEVIKSVDWENRVLKEGKIFTQTELSEIIGDLNQQNISKVINNDDIDSLLPFTSSSINNKYSDSNPSLLLNGSNEDDKIEV